MRSGAVTDLLACLDAQLGLAAVTPPVARDEEALEARYRVPRAPLRHLARRAVAARVVARRVVPAAVRHRLAM